jgi:hypothetical protein
LKLRDSRGKLAGMESDFTEIKIVGLEEEMTVASFDHPQMQLIFLKLSQTPPPLWRSYFKEARNVSRHAHWRKAWIDRRFIVVECLPEEIEAYHLRDLKQDVARCNERCHAYFAGQARAERQKKHADHNVREQLREMKDRLRFD